MSASRFGWGPGDLVVSQCALCKHKRVGVAACDAYPDRIPAEILRNAADHRRPQPGDGGVRFEARPGVSPDALDALLRVLDDAT